MEEFDNNPMIIEKYSKSYSENNLLKKIQYAAKSAGVKIIYAVMILYCLLIDDKVPTKDKTLIIGAFGYFILPIDIIPDFLPGGFTDDFAALLCVIKMVASNITPEIKEKAKNKVVNIFGQVSDDQFELF
ncbi:MAG: DUF1232 domain-containing protein [Bacteroidales bacterium]|nr:DUF1232 domain-containing protein [Bacteroidales bacterium]